MGFLKGKKKILAATFNSDAACVWRFNTDD
jgi:hypothetical protein